MNQRVSWETLELQGLLSSPGAAGALAVCGQRREGSSLHVRCQFLTSLALFSYKPDFRSVSCEFSARSGMKRGSGSGPLGGEPWNGWSASILYSGSVRVQICFS